MTYRWEILGLVATLLGLERARLGSYTTLRVDPDVLGHDVA